MNNLYKTNSGLSILGFVFLGLIIILVLGYFNISIRTVATNPTSEDNLEYVGDTSRSLWDQYLRDPATYLWHDIWLELFWRPFISNMKKLNNGEQDDIQQHVPSVSY